MPQASYEASAARIFTTGSDSLLGYFWLLSYIPLVAGAPGFRPAHKAAQMAAVRWAHAMRPYADSPYADSLYASELTRFQIVVDEGFYFLEFFLKQAQAAFSWFPSGFLRRLFNLQTEPGQVVRA